MILVKDGNPIRQFMRVWKIDSHEKYTDLRASTSERKEDGGYINSNWFPRCIGHAHNKMKDVKEGDTIVVTSFRISNETGKGRDGATHSYFRMLLLDFELSGKANGGQQASQPAPKQKEEAEPAEEADDAPW